MTNQEIGILLCSFPFVLFAMMAYAGAWLQAVEDYEELNNNAGIIVMSVLTFVIACISFGVYLMTTK